MPLNVLTKKVDYHNTQWTAKTARLTEFKLFADHCAYSDEVGHLFIEKLSFMTC